MWIQGIGTISNFQKIFWQMLVLLNLLSLLHAYFLLKTPFQCDPKTLITLNMQLFHQLVLILELPATSAKNLLRVAIKFLPLVLCSFEDPVMFYLSLQVILYGPLYINPI